MKPLSVYAQAATVGLHTALISVLILAADGVLGLIFALLLLPALPGLVRGREYTYGWACMQVTVYASFLIAEPYADRRADVQDLLIAGLAALDFSAMLLFARWRKRERAAQTAE